jgi:hypothetical protein
VRELEPCPSCGSGDVGGASGIVHCYKCKAEVRAATTPEAAEKWNARAIFMRHGFIVPVESEQFHAAARELIARSNAGEVAIQHAARDLPDDYLLEVGIERGAGWVDLTDPCGEKVEFNDDTDGSMTQRIRNATAAAVEHALGEKPPKRFGDKWPQKLRDLLAKEGE